MKYIYITHVMLDFICMDIAELWGMGSKRKNQNENKCTHRESNHGPLAFQPGSLGHLTKLMKYVF